MDDVFAVQDEIVRNVVGALAVRVTELERERAFEQPTDDLEAYDLMLRGREHLRQVSRMSNVTARQMFEQAIDLDPDYAEAYADLSLTYAYDAMFGWSEWPDRAIESSRENAEKAVTLDSQSAVGHAVLGFALYYRQSVDEAIRQLERAIDLNPNDPHVLGIHGDIMTMSGQPQEAVRSLEKALRLDPKPFPWWITSLGYSYYLLERYDDAIAIIDRYGPWDNQLHLPFVVLAAAHAQLGDIDAASAAVDQVRRTSPFFNAELYVTIFQREEDRDHLLDGLRMAGLE
jgi:tetratricopeptide (TPR) repeat protein